MTRRCNVRYLMRLSVALTLLTMPATLAPQEPSPCTLQRCALHVHAGNTFLRLFGPFDPSFVVQGDPEVVRYWLDPSDRFEDVFAERDTAEAHYARFVTEDARADALRSLSNLLFITYSIAFLVRGDSGGWPVAVGLGSIGLRLAAEIPAARARTQFRRAADIYNGSLTQP
jgi:hypothetical protein